MSRLPLWPHRPVGRVLVSLGVALLAAPALWLDATAAHGEFVAWHASSTVVLAALALWALWAPQLPRTTGLVLAGAMGLLLKGALLVAARPLWLAGTAGAGGAPLLALLAAASLLFFVGIRWARREIRW